MKIMNGKAWVNRYHSLRKIEITCSDLETFDKIMEMLKQCK